ncbi:MAG: hypothetical protein GQ527_00395 [Bacteroidales bacterium]|nr:hypothetical protein [Bacteroidales bacterium]
MKDTIRVGLFEFTTSGNNVSISLQNIKEEEKDKVSLAKHKKKKNQKNTQKK